MALHLIKLAVGIRDLDHLAEVQQGRAFMRDGARIVPGYTRRMPTRGDEVCDGGSIYWVVKGAVRCRQPVLGFELVQDGEGESWCRLLLDPVLVPVEAQPRKAFQGWRYLKPEEAPRDLGAGQGGGVGEDAMPPEMLAELRALGLA
ncbi:DUF1489 family protein [Arenibaculum pallidiluteum]|uniref:DUF1489 family protein n=1 Tax=Arenibaculum pallidiluteum TaxID=2812559 RepID=UPI001A97284C|nr:DUF1489 domain-containing protein [Arenibaculum pallidiluteum]